MITVVDINTKQVAVHVAGLLQKVAVPSLRHRKDIGDIQVDKVVIHEPTDNGEYPALQFSFEMANGLGAEVRVRLDQFAADPHGYIKDLLGNLRDMQFAAMQRRSGQRLMVAGVRQATGI